MNLRTFQSKKTTIRFLEKIARKFAKMNECDSTGTEKPHAITAFLATEEVYITKVWRKKEKNIIEVRQRFNRMRIDIYEGKNFVSIEYGENKENKKWQYRESQIFYEGGIELFKRVLEHFKRQEKG